MRSTSSFFKKASSTGIVVSSRPVSDMPVHNPGRVSIPKHCLNIGVLLCLALTALPCAANTSATKTPDKPAAKPAKTSLKPAAKPEPHIEFLRDVAPILDRSGCSTAGCHGKFGGRGGFQVSLLTLSPEDDFDPIVYGARGRRINFLVPEKSLLLQKATMEVPHAGGPRFTTDSPQYKTILRWIKQGASFATTDPRLVTLTMKPDKAMLQKVGQKIPLRVIASYTDGSTRDVTKQTSYQSTNAGVLSVTTEGVVSGARWGGGAILGRYLGTISASFFTLPQARKGVYPMVPATNVIDRMVFDNLQRLNVVPSNLSSDTEFLRRVTLDTLGRLPTPEEIAAFTADAHADKRTKMIDALLARPEFADLRALRLSDLLRVNQYKLGNGSLGDRAAALFYEWIWNSVNENKPWDKFAHEIIAARGSTYQVGPACFYRIEREANNRMENVGQAFLGVRMSCARCHKHPFDRWTTDDYWNFASFTNKISNNGGKLIDEEVITYNGGAELQNQSVTGRNRGKVAPPTYLGDKKPADKKDDMVVALADWMTDVKNPFFARATINRLWSYYFGRGIIHPVDDMRATTPESVPGLLDALAKELVGSHYDVKQVIRLILNSRTYQLSSIPNASNAADDRFFSHFTSRPMPAQVLLDMLDQACGKQEQFGAFPERSHAIQTATPIGNEFLNAFGQSHREFLTDLDPKLEPNLVQTLAMINSPYIEDKIRQGQTSTVIAKQAKSEADIVRDCFLHTFCRLPSASESAKAIVLLKQAKDRNEGTQDLLWALVTSREFYFNH